MSKKLNFLAVILHIILSVNANDILGCGGFIKSHVQIDFSKVVVKLYTKAGIFKDQTNCAPNNGYYFIPLYDKGDYILQLQPPPGWSFTPNKVSVSIDGKTDICSLGKDINFIFKGFGITGKVESFGQVDGPAGVNVELKSNGEVRNTITEDKGVFFFTPVYPGNYVLTASHPRWNFLKKAISVTVTEGNTELSPNSLVISGYDVAGNVKSDGEPITGANIILYADNNVKNSQVTGCDNSKLSGYDHKPNFICHVKSDERGNFIFPSVPNGAYHLVPFYKGQTIHFEPNQVSFKVSHDSVKLNENFEIVGFSVSGKILDAANGKPLKSAQIALNGKDIGFTKSDGSYRLEKIRAGIHSIQVNAENYKFEPKAMRVNPSLVELPHIYPTSYKVCGSVISDKMETVHVSITRIGSTQHIVLQTEPNTGEFCEFLTPGKYQIQVNVAFEDKALQFFPITQTVEVTSIPINDITFSQLKAEVSGQIRCQKTIDCANIKILFKSAFDDGSEHLIADIVDGVYDIRDVRPGSYKISLTPNHLCWNHNEYTISVTSAVFKVPEFIQTGYLISFISSHDTKITYKTPGQESRTEALTVQKGTTQHCVQKAGSYSFHLDGCHRYASNAMIEYSTDQDIHEIIILATKHRNTISISAAKNFGPIFVSVNIAGKKEQHGPLNFETNKYKLDLSLAPGEPVVLIPQSDILYFNPPILSMEGKNDCADLGIQFEAKKGRVFKGRINPPLEGVQITVESENLESLVEESDSDGFYKFPPQDDSQTYKVTAQKDSYVLIGPDDQGDFLAHKLAEIIVEVTDQNDNTPLQGALLSLSGAESYRSNLQTDDAGKITFTSLGPSQYFLKPMMKEYSFEPASKIINVEVGASVKVQLKGKRVAYSAFGQVTSLNNQPEERMIVIATGINNCTDFSEEATTEAMGQFRIRGLTPYCSYEIKVKGCVDENDKIERATPDNILLPTVTKDVSNLRLIVFRTSANTDVLIKVYTKNPEHYKNLIVKVTRESPPVGLVHNLKIDTSSYKILSDNNAGILVQMPSVPLDYKMYSVQLESTSSSQNKGVVKIKTFTADNSFKYIELEFVVKANVTDQHIKQTSIWTLLFIFVAMFSAYNVQKIVKFIKLPNTNIDAFFKAKQPSSEYIIDNNDIDQIVESINAPKKKVKSKRI